MVITSYFRLKINDSEKIKAFFYIKHNSMFNYAVN
ncbi:hypothetical protein J2W48_003618 [Flavobacterium piscis]|uniref:Transposase n=1 Tax=Flavobacterium piscis TaxID=1114874 RepID=A0ABU1YDR1_9FLAO|nr:hypothetical protein [Flavobacterium piscis]